MQVGSPAPAPAPAAPDGLVLNSPAPLVDVSLAGNQQLQPQQLPAKKFKKEEKSLLLSDDEFQ